MILHGRRTAFFWRLGSAEVGWSYTRPTVVTEMRDGQPPVERRIPDVTMAVRIATLLMMVLLMVTRGRRQR